MSIEQKIARLALGKFTTALNTPGVPDPYVTDDRTLLGETDYGTIMAARSGTEDYWEAFDFRKPDHMEAWKNTRRTGKLNFLDLEPSDSGIGGTSG